MSTPTPSNPPGDAQLLAARAVQQLQKWEQLRDELKALHAELEYLRLMVKLGKTK